MSDNCFAYVHEQPLIMPRFDIFLVTDALTQSCLCVPAWATAGPRRMSERDLPSRLGHDAAPQQIHSSKSVPALHSK